MEWKLMEQMQQPDYVPLTIEELGESLHLGKAQMGELESIVEECLQSGTLVKLKGNRYCLPKDADLITGVIRFRQSGSAMIHPVITPGQPTFEPVWVRAEDTWVAMHEDRVVARMIRETKKPKWKKSVRRSVEEPDRKTARVIRILKRARDTVTGTLASTKFFHYVIPDDPRMIHDIIVEDPSVGSDPVKAKVNDKVVVRLHEWKQRHVNPEGDIIEVLGETHTPMAEYRSILHKFGLSPVFPECVDFELQDIPDRIDDKVINQRKDFRNVFTLTIDPDDAKDFDDALSLEYMDGGDLKIGVHIADVSHYVRPGSALDKEAKKRGNSTYLVGTVIPMLPERLSNGLCSLVEDQDRLVKSVEFHFSKQGKLKGHRFYNGVIRSRKRLTYGQALAFMRGLSSDAIRGMPMPLSHQTGNTGKPVAELSDSEMDAIRNALKSLWSIASGLREARMRKGSLDLDMPEVKIYVDPNGYADRIVKNESDESHQLVEEWMLLANQTVAKDLKAAQLALIYRVHDKPDDEKLSELSEYMATFGVQVGDLSNRKEVVKMLQRIQKHPQEHTLKVQFLRSLKQACYRSTSDGHYGLSMDNYTHFTSPIRRYADLIVHRVFDIYLRKKGFSTAPLDESVAFSASQMASIAEHLSITESRSAEAERETVKTKLMEYFEKDLSRPVRTPFGAIVTDIKNHGMFVELTDSMAFGLVHISTMGDDLYGLDRDGVSLVGRRTGKTYRIGQKMEVVVERVDRFKRQIDFRIHEKAPGSSDSAQSGSLPGKNSKRDLRKRSKS